MPTRCRPAVTALLVGCAAVLVHAGIATPADLRPEIADHTALPYADAATLPEALQGMYLPEGALDRLTEVFSAGGGPVRSVQLAWLSGDRYLWRVELARSLAAAQTMSVYVDTDADEATGRPDARGAELLLQVSSEGSRPLEWMADGTPSSARMVRAAVESTVAWFSYDYPLGAADGSRRFRFWISLGTEGIDPVEAIAPAGGPTAGLPAGVRVEAQAGADTDDRRSAIITVTNDGDRERWIDLNVPLTLPFEGEFRWFDAFHFTPHDIGIAPIAYHGISAVLPLTCAWDGQTGIALALNPMDWYTELHTSVRPSDGGYELTLGTRLALMPGESERFEVLALRFDGRLGWRGAFEAYWRAFPEVYDRPRDIDPRFHLASAGGLYRSWSDPDDERFAGDLIRRLHGHWEWGYAPAPRPGEWAVSELSAGEWTRSRGTVKKSFSAEALPETWQRIRRWVHDNAQLADVAVAYYMHLKNVEKGLMEQYWPDSYFRNQPIEYMGYYQQTPCWYAYPYADSYGDYITRSIPLIIERFSPAGIAFDSVFGFIPHWGPSADRSPATTFDNGLAFVGEGIGFARQMDVVRQQRSGNHRTAMVTNLKLPTLSADAVRTDCALLEFHPMSNPSYRERMLRLRMLSGQIGFNWWNTYDPALYRWIPWDRLNQQQTLDAFRRLRDDMLIHSLYYGGVPNARFAVGIPKLMRAIPMLLEVADLGWQPVIGARAEDADLLISRFGEGLGMALGVGNQTYERQQGRVVLDARTVADGIRYAFAAWGDEPTATDLSGQAPAVGVAVPPRDVMAVRAILAVPRDRVGSVAVTGSNALPIEQWRRHLPGSWSIALSGLTPGPLEVSVWVPEHARNVTATLNGEPLACERRGSALRATVRAPGEKALLTVSWQPAMPLQGDLRALLDYPFVRNRAPGCSVVAYGRTRDLAFRVQEYFREYYRWAVDEPRTIKLPIITPEQADEGRRVIVGLADDLSTDLQIDLGDAEGAFGVRDDVVYATARTPELLERAVEGLLFTLDQKYEYWGPYFPTQHFFTGDPSKSPAALQAAGMAGRLLTGNDTGSLREVMELPELIEWP